MKMRARHSVILISVLALFQFLWSEQSSFITSNYEKHEYMIPMRDGKKLFTAVYAPRDGSHKYPIMLNRTPYGVPPYGEKNYPLTLGPSEEMAKDKYIFVYQDVRGRMMSEGEFIYMTPMKASKNGPTDIDESTDAFDTIDWLVKNVPNTNGRVGIWGISFPGFYAAAALVDAHPALKAASPQAPIADWFIGDDFHHNGAFFLAHGFGFLATFGFPRSGMTTQAFRPFDYPTPDGYDFFLKMGPLLNANAKYLKHKVSFWNEMMNHGDYDEFWQSRNLLPNLKNINPAVMTVGGWFDAEDLFGALNVYKSIECSSPGAYNVLVMGPWRHGGWIQDGGGFGNVRFGSDTSGYYWNQIEFPFFKSFLKEESRPKLPEAFVFMTGRNEWQRENSWPPTKTIPLRFYLDTQGRLSSDFSMVDEVESFDEYLSDPNKPVPYTQELAAGMRPEYMVEDQRFAARRPDVLVFKTDPLDHDISIAGPVVASLNVSTSGTDSDFIVKLIDVYPDTVKSDSREPETAQMSGCQQLVRGEPFRGKYRNSFTRPIPFTPGQIAKVEFAMPDVCHTFLKGHRIMTQIQSSWFPLVDRNPQQFVNIYGARESDYKKATQRIYHSKSNPSYILLNIVK
jgi:uncharacterized protein